MRIWHTFLIDVLPREQLIAAWRELSAITGSIQKNGTPNHLLVNFVLDYDYDHFISYTKIVRDEMTRRGYRTMDSVWNKIISLKPDWKEIQLGNIYHEKMNTDYFQICYYNLREKWLCGGIKAEEWGKIEQRQLMYMEE